MAKLGTKARPIIVRVHSDQMAYYVADTCSRNGWHYIIGFEPDKPEDISDLEKMLEAEPPRPLQQDRSQRTLSLQERQEVQEVLRGGRGPHGVNAGLRPRGAARSDPPPSEPRIRKRRTIQVDFPRD